jgi:tetratricopeptide (TPR) repeat protein
MNRSSLPLSLAILAVLISGCTANQTREPAPVVERSRPLEASTAPALRKPWGTQADSSGNARQDGRPAEQVAHARPLATPELKPEPLPPGPVKAKPAGVRPMPEEAGKTDQPVTTESVVIKPLQQRTLPAEAANSPAASLLRQANRQVAEGDLDAAAASLERALRIDVRNSIVWQQLAEVRLRQNKPRQAEALALKSNALANDDKRLEARNWQIVAQALLQQGDKEGARKARDLAMKLAESI